MKQKFLKLVVLVTFIASIAGCGICKQNNQNNDTPAGQAMHAVTYFYNGIQMDSLCIADNLPSDLDNQWNKRVYYDYETKESITRYMYIKFLDDDEQLIYIVTNKGDQLYVVTKREVIKSE